MEILGIDIGGSGIKGAVVDVDSGKLITNRMRIPTPNPATPKAVTQTVVEIVNQFDWKGLIGCGFPAVVQQGKIRTASNIDKKWINQEVSKLFSNASGCDTCVINDADAAGLAEMKFGAGKDENGVVVIITVGTGLGTSFFSAGCLFANTELGHLLMNGKIAEHYTSDAVRKSEDLSWKNWSLRFNAYLSEIDRLFWPDLIVIGGGVSKKKDKYFHLLETNAKIVTAELRNEAGIIGAALAANGLK
jgi:polyphosphate glucokinase